MNKISIILAICLMGSSSALFAKCFTFKKSDIRVCIDGNSNAERKKAQDICDKANGSDCGGISGYSGNCKTAGKVKCFDGSGSEQKDLKAD
jgi:hypothetical protein